MLQLLQNLWQWIDSDCPSSATTPSLAAKRHNKRILRLNKLSSAETEPYISS